MAARKTNSVKINIEASTKGLDEGLGKSTASLNRFSRLNKKQASVGNMIADKQRSNLAAIGRTAKFASIALAGMAVAGIGYGLKLNAQWETNEKSFGTLLGSMKKGKKMMEDLRQVSKKSYFRLTDFQEVTKRLIGVGVAAKDVVPMMEGVNAAVIAVGGDSQKLSQVTDALGQIQAKGKVTGRELMRLQTAGVPINKILQKEFGLTAEEVGNIGHESVDADRALKAISDNWTKRYGPGLERSMKTGAAQVQNLQKNFEGFLRMATEGLYDTLAKEVLPEVNKELEGLTDILASDKLTGDQKLKKLKKNLERIFYRIGDVVDDLIPKIMDAIEKALPYVAEAGVKLGAQLMKSVGKAFMNASPLGKGAIALWMMNMLGGKALIVKAGMAIGTRIAVGISTAIAGSQVLNSTMATVAAQSAGAGGAGAGAGAGGGLIGGVGKFAKYGKFAKIGGIGLAAGAAGTMLGGGDTSAGGLAMSAGSGAAIGMMAGPWGAAIGGALGLAIPLIIEHWDSIKGAAEAALDWIITAATDAWTAISTPFIDMAKWIGNAFGNIKNAAGDAFGFISDKISAAVGFVKEYWRGLVLLLGPIGLVILVLEKLAKQLAGPVASAFGWVKTAASDAFGWIKTAATDVGDWISGAFKKVKGVVTGVFDSIAGIVSGVAKKVSNFFQPAVNKYEGARDKFNSITSSIGKGIAKGFRAAWKWVKGIFSKGIKAAGDAIKKMGPKIKAFMKDPLVEGGKAIRDIFNALVKFVASIPGRFWNGLKALGGIALKAGKAVVSAFRSTVGGLGGKVFGWAKKVPSKIFDAIKGGLGSLKDLGKMIVDAIIDGIKASPGAIADAVGDLLPGPVKDALGLAGGAAGKVAGWAFGNTGGLVTNRGIIGMARGGSVPGLHPKDTVPAMLQPGEFVIKKDAADKLTTPYLRLLNKGKGGVAKGDVRKEGEDGADELASIWTDVGKDTDDKTKKTEKDVVKNFEGLRKGSVKKSKDTENGVAKNFGSMRKRSTKIQNHLNKSVGNSWKDIEKDTAKRNRSMESHTRNSFGNMKKTVDQQGNAMSGSMRGTMGSLKSSVFGGFGAIAAETNKALSALGVPKVSFGSSAAKKHAVGGFVAGTGKQDTVPMFMGMVAPGEAILNGAQQAEVERSLAMTQALGIGGHGSLDELFQKVTTPHYAYAKGGKVKGYAGGGWPELQPGARKLANELHGMGFAPGSTTGGQHSPTSNHYGGNAIDFGDRSNSMPRLWSVLRPKANQFAELFGPSNMSPGPTLMHNGVGFSDGALQAQHNDHIHVAILGALRGGLSLQEIKRRIMSGPDGALKSAGQAALDKVWKGAKGYVKKKSASSMVSMSGGGGASGDYQKMGRQMMMGVFPASEWPALRELWTRESGWNPAARNPSSGAYGIPQSLPASKMGAAAQGDGPEAAKAQIAWGLKYIKDRYGSPSAALAHHDGNNWYARGGVVKQVAEVLARQGFSHKAAAGVIGNAWGESGWNPAAMEPGTDNGGLWGFTSGEKSLSRLRAYADKRGKPWTDPVTQTQFMLMSGGRSLRSRMNSMDSIADTTKFFMDEYERPYVPTQNLARRVKGGFDASSMMRGWKLGGSGGKSGGKDKPLTKKEQAAKEAKEKRQRIFGHRKERLGDLEADLKKAKKSGNLSRIVDAQMALYNFYNNFGVPKKGANMKIWRRFQKDLSNAKGLKRRHAVLNKLLYWAKRNFGRSTSKNKALGLSRKPLKAIKKGRRVSRTAKAKRLWDQVVYAKGPKQRLSSLKNVASFYGRNASFSKAEKKKIRRLTGRYKDALKTTGTGDDIKALSNLARYERKHGDIHGLPTMGPLTVPGGKSPAKGAKGDRAAEALEVQKEHNAMLKEQNRLANLALEVSQSQYGSLRGALADVVSGEIGGRVGLNAQTSYPGQLARL